VIDLHCHILPGVDDGPAVLATTIGMAEAAAAEGVTTIVATPHVSHRYPTTPEQMLAGVEAVNEALAGRGVPVTVVPGAEIAMPAVSELSDDELASFGLAGGRSLLVESPFTPQPQILETMVFDLQLRGFRPILAHPERSPAFQTDLERLGQMVQRGVRCSITASSMSGRFGGTVRRVTLRMLREGLVHDVASDAHDEDGRPPGLLAGFESAERELPGISQHASWFTQGAPEALLAGEPLPPGPDPAGWRWRGWRRLLAR
jgi:protein-tyrosine phosphatase